jgi:hypothetical protein
MLFKILNPIKKEFLSLFFVSFIYTGCASNGGPSLGGNIATSLKDFGQATLEVITYQDIQPFMSPYGDGKGQIRKRIDGQAFDIKGGTFLKGETIPTMTKFYSMNQWRQNNRTVLMLYGASDKCNKTNWLIDMDPAGYSMYNLGNCGKSFDLKPEDNGVFKIVENNSRDPLVYLYDSDGLSEGKLASVWNTEHKADEENERQANSSNNQQMISNPAVQPSANTTSINKTKNTSQHLNKPFIRTFDDSKNLKKVKTSTKKVKQTKTVWQIDKS